MKTVIIQNFNNKLCNDFFMHIDFAPKSKFSESSFPIPVKISEAATSGPVSLSELNKALPEDISFDAEIIDLSRIELNNLSSLITYASFGMSREEFISYWIQQNPTAMRSDEMIVYVVRKIK